MKSKCKYSRESRVASCELWVVAFFILSFILVPGRAVQAQEKPQERVTLQFQGVDIREVLKILAEQAGFNLVAGRNVAGQVTLFVKEVDPWEAFEVILAANELAYERQGEILSIMTQRDYELLHGQPYQDRRVFKSMILRYSKVADVSRALTQMKSNIGRVIADEATNTLILMDTPTLVEQMSGLAQGMDQPLETRIFPINYGTVKALTPVLQEAVTKGVGRVLADERSNQAAVTDYPAKLEEIGRIVQAFDERSRQVLIDAKILQVTLSDKFQLGIDWEVLARENITIKGPNALNLTAGGSLKIAQAALSSAGDYKILVEALRTFGNTRILSEPRITVLNNQEAKILVGSKEPYVTTQISQTGTGTAVTAETVNFIDIGVKLFVTPTISRDRFVSMKIRPEVSSRTGTLTTGQKNEVPIVETTEAETVLMVEDGGMVILGGLIKDEVSKDQQRIPFLGDLPVLGIPFRSTKETVKKTELVVFLTPHVLTGSRQESLLGPGQEGRSAAPVDEGLHYYGRMVDLIQAVAQAQAPLARASGTVVVHFALRPDGRLVGRPQVVSSGSRLLDRLAVQAVQAASPFPPFPSAWKKRKTFRVPITYP